MSKFRDLTPLPTYQSAFNFAAAGSGNAVEIVWAAGLVRVLEFYLTKPSAQVTAILRKQSAASTGGTAVSQTRVPINSANPAVGSTVNVYTAVPTAGALIGNIFRDVVATTDRIDILFERLLGQPLTLISAGESLALNVDAAATLTGFITWTESTS